LARDEERRLRIAGTVVEQKVHKVIEMEVEPKNREDVTEPDAVVSGMAGTGQEYKNETGIAGRTEAKSPHVTHERVVIGLGVLYNGKIIPCTLKDATKDPDTLPEVAENTGDLIFSLFDRQDRIKDRIQKKIERLDQWITKSGNRGRSQ